MERFLLIFDGYVQDGFATEKEAIEAAERELEKLREDAVDCGEWYDGVESLAVVKVIAEPAVIYRRSVGPDGHVNECVEYKIRQMEG